MKAAYTVKIGGKFYRAGETLPGIPEEEKQYSRSEITRMNAAKLRKVARENGIENTDEISRAELIPIIVEKLGV